VPKLTRQDIFQKKEMFAADGSYQSVLHLHSYGGLVMGIFSPNPERLARSITEDKLDDRVRARLFRKLLGLTPTAQWLRAMMIVAMDRYESEATFAALPLFR
jgi:hypothetical protein